jgi:hypothetical protein
MALPRRRGIWIAIAVAVAAVAAVVLVWFQPQKLLIDERIDEAAPTAENELARGEFVSLDHGTSGTVRVIDLGAARVVRLEALKTDNGPDLYLYLSTNPPDGDEGAFDDDVVNLGRLKGNEGNQNYDLPAGVDLSRYASVVIWCDRFNSAFGAAPLTT